MIEIELKQNVHNLLSLYLKLKREYEGTQRENSIHESAENRYLSSLQKSETQIRELKQEVERLKKLLQEKEEKFEKINTRVNSIYSLVDKI